jgi:glycosyltransferase involved in cell wall biosynthesis
MNLKNVIKRLRFVRKRDGNLLFIKNLFYYYPKVWIFLRLQVKLAYKFYLKKEYSTEEVLALKQFIAQSKEKPLISIVMPTYKSNLRYLRLAIDSVLRQTYPHWELCIVDDASNDSALTNYLTNASDKDSRIKCHFSQVNQHISRASNIGLQMSAGEFIVLLDHDDELAPFALAYLARVIIQNPNTKVIYSDEDKLSTKGSRYDPYFKCDWNYELFLSQNLISHLGAYNADLMRYVGGFREGYEGSQDYDLALRCIEHAAPEEIIHIPKVLYHWRVLPGSTALNIDEKPYAIVAAEKALNDHLRRTNQKGQASYFHYGYKISYAEAYQSKNVVVFIPIYMESECNQALQLAIELLKLSSVGEVVILHKLNISEAHKFNLPHLSYCQLTLEIEKESLCSIEIQLLKAVAHHQSAFNYRLLLAPDAQFKGDAWLTELINHLTRQQIAAVSNAGFNTLNQLVCGPKVINKSRQAITPFQGLSEQQVAYGGRNQLTQQLSALDLDCLLINSALVKNTISESEGIESSLELFLLLRSKGLRLIWAPSSKIYFTSASRLNYAKLKETQEKSDNKGLGNAYYDEFYSPNFLDGPHCFMIDHKMIAKSESEFKFFTERPSDV